MNHTGPVDDDTDGHSSSSCRRRGGWSRVVDFCVVGARQAFAVNALRLDDRQQTGQRHAGRQTDRYTDERRADVRHDPDNEVEAIDLPQPPTSS